MKLKKILIAAIAVVIATAVFSSYQNMALAAGQSEGAIPQSGDLCNGTGGNGQIVSVGNNEFTIKRNDNGNNQIIYLTGGATIETSTGVVPLSDLKAGDRVTLVGGPNPDGSFAADTVVVCAATGIASTSPEAALVTEKNKSDYEHVNGVINTVTLLCVGLIWLGIAAYLLLKKRKGFVYLLFFTIFYIYLYKVLDYTLIQFQSLLLLQHFLPNLMLRGVDSGRKLNLIPLVTLRVVDMKTSLLNVLMMMPFGFGLPFITNFRFKKVVVAGLLLSIIIEFLQFITGFIANTSFRIADVNDLIFNTVGVAIGFILFVVFVRIYRRVSRNWKMRTNPVLRYIAERPQIDGAQ
jgi:glycopeptide antibiotics resistance protein